MSVKDTWLKTIQNKSNFMPTKNVEDHDRDEAINTLAEFLKETSAFTFSEDWQNGFINGYMFSKRIRRDNDRGMN